MIDPSSAIGMIINNLAQYVFGSIELTGLWIAVLFFGILSTLRIEFIIGLVALVPITLVMMAYGMIFPLAGGLIILAVAVISAGHFFAK